jgi:hypothetical protein
MAWKTRSENRVYMRAYRLKKKEEELAKGMPRSLTPEERLTREEEILTICGPYESEEVVRAMAYYERRKRAGTLPS